MSVEPLSHMVSGALGVIFIHALGREMAELMGVMHRSNISRSPRTREDR